MTSNVYFKDKKVACSNMHFGNLVQFAIEQGVAAELSLENQEEVLRVQTLNDSGAFWPGRGWTIEEDFPTVAQCKIWCGIFYDVAQSIFMREVGNHTNASWQSRYISQAMGIGDLFLEAVREKEKRWFPDTRAARGAAEAKVATDE